jgi:hypothetical protein
MGFIDGGIRLVTLIITIALGVWMISAIGTVLGQNTSLFTGLLLLIAIVAVIAFMKKGLDL